MKFIIENKDSSYTMYLDKDDLYGKAVSAKIYHFQLNSAIF